MTPKDKHTEVAWQAKQREVKTGSVEKTVHSATSAIYYCVRDTICYEPL